MRASRPPSVPMAVAPHLRPALEASRPSDRRAHGDALGTPASDSAPMPDSRVMVTGSHPRDTFFDRMPAVREGILMTRLGKVHSSKGGGGESLQDVATLALGLDRLMRERGHRDQAVSGQLGRAEGSISWMVRREYVCAFTVVSKGHESDALAAVERALRALEEAAC